MIITIICIYITLGIVIFPILNIETPDIIYWIYMVVFPLHTVFIFLAIIIIYGIKGWKEDDKQKNKS